MMIHSHLTYTIILRDILKDNVVTVSFNQNDRLLKDVEPIDN